MPSVFSNAPGVISVFTDYPGIPFRMEGWAGGPTFKAIVTSAGVSAKSNVQFIHTLRDLIYVYVFGERAANFSVSGIIVGGDCTGGGSGIDSVLDYYNRYRISATGGRVALQLGTTSAGSFSGFLVEAPQIVINDPAMNIGAFSLNFQVFPRK